MNAMRNGTMNASKLFFFIKNVTFLFLGDTVAFYYIFSEIAYMKLCDFPNMNRIFNGITLNFNGLFVGDLFQQISQDHKFGQFPFLLSVESVVVTRFR